MLISPNSFSYIISFSSLKVASAHRRFNFSLACSGTFFRLGMVRANVVHEDISRYYFAVHQNISVYIVVNRLKVHNFFRIRKFRLFKSAHGGGSTKTMFYVNSFYLVFNCFTCALILFCCSNVYVVLFNFKSNLPTEVGNRDKDSS